MVEDGRKRFPEISGTHRPPVAIIRLIYIIIFHFLGPFVWPGIINRRRKADGFQRGRKKNKKHTHIVVFARDTDKRIRDIF